MLDWMLKMTRLTRLPQLTLDDYQNQFANRHLLLGILRTWSAERPDAPALIAADGSRSMNWAQFERSTAALATDLLSRGFRKGDYVVTLLPMTVEHVVLEFACFRIGVIVVPLDLRLTAVETVRAIDTLKPRGFFALGTRGPLDQRPLWQAVLAAFPWIEQRFAVESLEPVEGAICTRGSRASSAMARAMESSNDDRRLMVAENAARPV